MYDNDTHSFKHILLIFTLRRNQVFTDGVNTYSKKICGNLQRVTIFIQDSRSWGEATSIKNGNVQHWNAYGYISHGTLYCWTADVQGIMRYASVNPQEATHDQAPCPSDWRGGDHDDDTCCLCTCVYHTMGSNGLSSEVPLSAITDTDQRTAEHK